MHRSDPERRRRRAERAIALTIAGGIAFNYPIASLIAREHLFGMPGPFVYLFLAWGAFIALLALVLEK